MSVSRLLSDSCRVSFFFLSFLSIYLFTYLLDVFLSTSEHLEPMGKIFLDNTSIQFCFCNIFELLVSHTVKIRKFQVHTLHVATLLNKHNCGKWTVLRFVAGVSYVFF